MSIRCVVENDRGQEDCEGKYINFCLKAEPTADDKAYMGECILEHFLSNSDLNAIVYVIINDDYDELDNYGIVEFAKEVGVYDRLKELATEHFNELFP